MVDSAGFGEFWHSTRFGHSESARGVKNTKNSDNSDRFERLMRITCSKRSNSSKNLSPVSELQKKLKPASENVQPRSPGAVASVPHNLHFTRNFHYFNDLYDSTSNSASDSHLLLSKVLSRSSYPLLSPSTCFSGYDLFISHSS